jgi:hypothetical protein
MVLRELDLPPNLLRLLKFIVLIDRRAISKAATRNFSEKKPKMRKDRSAIALAKIYHGNISSTFATVLQRNKQQTI